MCYITHKSYQTFFIPLYKNLLKQFSINFKYKQRAVICFQGVQSKEHPVIPPQLQRMRSHNALFCCSQFHFHLSVKMKMLQTDRKASYLKKKNRYIYTIICVMLWEDRFSLFRSQTLCNNISI